MHVGVPKEIKSHESRVGLTPASVRELVRAGHHVIVQRDAGVAIGFADAAYETAGARIADDAAQVFAAADLVVKVKEPQPAEVALLRPGQVLFTYLHLAADRKLTEGLQRSQATCIAYETVTDANGSLPLLAPMSEVAGRLSIQVGAHHLERPQGGRGVLLGGVAGVPPGRVLILGGGVAGSNAAQMAVGLGAQVTIIDRSVPRLRMLDAQFAGRVRTLFATAESIEAEAIASDLVIGAVLIPGAAAPKLLSREIVSRMLPGAVLVDISIDQGGCFETSRPTTHDRPTFVIGGIVHYCVANMPAAVARTSTIALNNATLPYVLELANKGWKRALEQDPHLRNGLNIEAGGIVHPAVAQAIAGAA
jgi:alanine dehydrogenase